MATLNDMVGRIRHADWGLFLVVGLSPRKVLRKVEKDTGKQFCRYVLKTVDDLVHILAGPAVPTAIDMSSADGHQAEVLFSAMALRADDLLGNAPGGLLLFLSPEAADVLPRAGGPLYALRSAMVSADEPD